MAVCPEGTKYQLVYSGFIACLIVDLVLVAMFYFNKKSLGSVFKSKTSKNKEFNYRATVVGQSANVKLLVTAFEKALGGKQIGKDFRFNNLGLKLRNGQEVLKSVSGEIQSSRMTAIMGPSGAGKTTFMNVLCGKVSRTSGELRISGKEAEASQFKKLIGFVPQDDIMLRELTVREVLTHSARIRLPNTWSNQEIEEFVDNLLSGLK